MERMNPLDATFLAVEDTVNHMHIGSVSMFEGPAPNFDDVRATIGAKLPLVPRYRQKVRTAPWNIGRPVWIDDPNFRLDYHVRHAALAPPGDDEELCRFVGRVMSQQLDRNKPLWENWIVEGLESGSWALLTKIHHCMVDGIAGTDLFSVILNRTRDPAEEPAVPDVWVPDVEPTSAQLALHSLGGLARAPLVRGRAAIDSLRRPGDAVRGTARALGGLSPMARTLPAAPPSALTGPISRHRRWQHTRVALDDIKRVRVALGGTVNDVVLALVTRGYRDLLLRWNEPLPGREVRTLIPVSVRSESGRGVFDNRVSAMFAMLPVGIEDPVERLDTLRRQLEQLKASGEAATGEAAMGVADFTPPILTALAARLVVHRQHNIETAATNIPGPQFPLYLGGRQMLAAYPYIPLLGHVRTGVAIWSYLGAVHFGVTGDDDAAPPIEVICAGIDEGMRELGKAADESAPR